MESDERFILRAHAHAKNELWWLIGGAIFALLGIYALVWNKAVLFHFDSMLSRGEIQRTLAVVAARQDLHPITIELIDLAYYRFLPAAFSMFGSTSLGMGLLMIVYVRLQKRWIQIHSRRQEKQVPGK